MTLSPSDRHIVGSIVLLFGLAASAFAQEASLMPEGSQAMCATPMVNDPALVREAWANTLSLHPGIVEAVRQTNLRRTTLDYRVGDQNLFWVYNLQKKIFD